MNVEARELLSISRRVLAGESGSQFFTDEEMSMSARAHQKTSYPEELYEQAKLAREEMLDWLNRGKGVDRLLGLKRVDILSDDASECMEELGKPGGMLVVAPQKGMERSREKVEADYGGDWSRLVDVVRATIAVDEFASLKGVMGTLRDCGMVLARRPDDNFANPTAIGYRGLKMNVAYPCGHIGEIQVHLKEIFRTNLLCHGLYEVVRDIECAAKTDGRERLTVREAEIIGKINKWLSERYEKAWGRVVLTTASEEWRDEGKMAYYEYGGVPVVVESGCLPVTRVGGRRSVVSGYWRFLHEAHRISEKRYNEMTGI